jgi:tRNA U34 5-methylaminomethyl-2-thiouridine-forming methyltransferase MnmC
MTALQIITTSDGSHSILNTTLNETYHSVHGALQESLHVFIKNGLNFLLEKSSAETPQEIKILEIGLGTGLNALLTLQALIARPHVTVHYTSLEAFPLTKDIWGKLNYVNQPHAVNYFEKIHSANWNEWVSITPNFSILKCQTTLQQFDATQNFFDLVYFDAFAPNKQPEMWELPMLTKVARAMNAAGVFVTYCAKGQLKRDLKSLDLIVETLDGPPGKKEMVRAAKHQC